MRAPLSGLRGRSAAVGIVAVLAWAGLVSAWALAAPHGATRGAERTLVAIWCVDESVERCMPPVTFGGEDPGTRLVPSAIVGLGCVAADPGRSASCVADRTPVLGGASEVPTRLHDWLPDIPETRDGRAARFLRWHSMQVSDDVEASIARMRRTNVALAVLLPALVMLLGTHRVRRGMTVSAVALVPLGLTLLGSLETASWTLTGALVTWAALLTSLEPIGRLRRSLAAAVAIVGGTLTLTPIAFEPMTTGPVLGMSVLAALVVRALDDRGRWWTPERTVLLLVGLLASLGVWRTYRHVPWELGLLSTEQWAREVVALPRALGDIIGAGMGPAGYAVDIAPWASLVVATVIVFVGLDVFRAARAAGRVLLGGAIGFIALQAVHVTVSQGFTVDLGMFAGRHFLPSLVVVLGAGVALAARERPGSTAWPVALAAAALTLAHASALRSRLVRYVADAPDRGGWPSATGWWWDIPVGPGVVWVLGSVAFAALAFLAVRHPLARRPEEEHPVATGHDAPRTPWPRTNTAASLLLAGILSVTALALVQDSLIHDSGLLALPALPRDSELMLWGAIAVLAARSLRVGPRRWPALDTETVLACVALALIGLVGWHHWSAGEGLRRAATVAVPLIALHQLRYLGHRRVTRIVLAVLVPLLVVSLVGAIGEIRVVRVGEHRLLAGALDFRVRGVFSWPIKFGAAASLAVIVALQGLHRRVLHPVLAGLTVVIGLASVLLADAMTAAFALTAAILVVGILRVLDSRGSALMAGPATAFAAAAGALGMVAFPFAVARLGNSGAITGRGHLWRRLFDEVRPRELLSGFGDRPLVNDPELFGRLNTFWGARHTHNTGLELWLTGGALGAVLFMCLVAAMIVLGIRRIEATRGWSLALVTFVLVIWSTENYLAWLAWTDRLLLLVTFALLFAWGADPDDSERSVPAAQKSARSG